MPFLISFKLAFQNIAEHLQPNKYKISMFPIHYKKKPLQNEVSLEFML